ncbi:MAG: NepR family anti-sigma factor [Pseudomonadota bacterium]
MIKRKSDSDPKLATGEKRDDSLGRALRKKYQDIQNEKIPDHLQKLIDALKEAERREKKGD